jgi:hypothetical protein
MNQRLSILDGAGDYWMGFTPDTSPDYARVRFKDRYGVDPERLWGVPGLLLVGPIPPSGEAEIERTIQDA